MFSTPVLTIDSVTQVFLRNALGPARGEILSNPRNAYLTCQQRPPTTKEKIAAVFARLDRLGLEENGGCTIDP